MKKKMADMVCRLLLEKLSKSNKESQGKGSSGHRNQEPPTSALQSPKNLSVIDQKCKAPRTNTVHTSMAREQAQTNQARDLSAIPS